jgi:hypothetical protein
MKIQGLEKFRDYFADYTDQYTLIGGAACYLAMDDAGLDFRATKDLDIVLCAESLNPAFVQRLWDFVQEAGYQRQERGTGAKQFYRFSAPGNAQYPSMLELFSRVPDGVVLTDEAGLTMADFGIRQASLALVLDNLNKIYGLTYE